MNPVIILPSTNLFLQQKFNVMKGIISMDFKLAIKIFFAAVPIIKDITAFIRNKSEERVMEKSIALKVLQNQKEELIDPLYIVEE